MPEGPEAATIAQKLHPIISGKKLLSIEISAKAKQKNMENVPLPVTIMSVSSYGKKVLFTLEGEKTILTSLGMSGRWQWAKGSHTEITLHLDDGLSLHFDQCRPIGSVEYLASEEELRKYMGKLGPDLLAREISEQDWRRIMRNKRIQNWQVAKALHYDQSIIAGIGNYLKSEILYCAKLRPDRMMKGLSDEELEQLRLSAHEIIRESYRHGGLTFESYWAPDGTHGVYPVRVYRKDGKAGRGTTDPLGNKVERGLFKDGRSTYWVPSVQV